MLKSRGFSVFTISIVAILLASLFLSVLFVVASDSSQVLINSIGSISTPFTAGLPNANYYVIAFNSLYYAINGSNQQNFFTNGNASTVINTVLGKMKAGQSIVINGSITLDSDIRVPLSDIRIDWWESNVTVTSANRCVLISNHDNITLANGTFWGRNDTEAGTGQYAVLGVGANYITVANATFHRFSYFQGVIQIDIGSHELIVNNTFTDNWNNYGVVFNYVNDSVIANNTIDAGHAGSAIGVFGDESVYCGNKNVTIANNTLSNFGPAMGHHYHVIYVTCTNGTDIYGNTITNETGATSFTIKSPNTKFHNNTISGIDGHGFQIWQEGGPAENPNGTKIYGNVITGIDTGSNWAFYLVPSPATINNPISGLLIDNNTVSGFFGFIALNHEPDSLIANTTIQSNVVSNCKMGIWIGNGGHSYVANVTILSNKFSNIGSPTLHIDTPTPNVLIAYNALYSCTAPVIQYFTTSIWIHDNIGLADYKGPDYGQ